MAVEWTSKQFERVVDAIEAYPVDSGLCVDLARAIVPIAFELDPQVHALLIKPKFRAARYVIQEIGFMRWRHHVTTAVDDHCVDALTGPAGTEHERYFLSTGNMWTSSTSGR